MRIIQIYIIVYLKKALQHIFSSEDVRYEINDVFLSLNIFFYHIHQINNWNNLLDLFLKYILNNTLEKVCEIIFIKLLKIKHCKSSSNFTKISKFRKQDGWRCKILNFEDFFKANYHPSFLKYGP